MRAARRRVLPIVLVIVLALLWAARAFAAGSVDAGPGARELPEMVGLS